MKDVEREKEICSYLEKKLDKFKEYQYVTEHMKQTVCGSDENNEFSVLINKRQKCIGAIDKINSSIERIVNSGSVKIASISNKYKKIIDGYLLSIKKIMMQVDLMDKELVAVVTQQGESIKNEILNMQNQRRAARGYYSNRRYPPKFLDTRK